MRIDEPSDRNFEIFCDVEQSGVSLRAAAAKYQISVGRVQQIVAQMRAWYRATSPAWTPDAPGVAMEGYRLLEGRLTYLYQQAMDGWRSSQGEQTQEREQASRVGSKTVTTTTSFGQVRYLAQAMRIAETQYKCAARHALFCQRLSRKTSDAPTSIAPPTGGYAREEERHDEVDESVAEQLDVKETQQPSYETHLVPVRSPESAETQFATPMRSRLAKKLARHEKRKAARERKRARQRT